MADATNIKLGVCEVTYNSTALGHTKGEVVVNYEPEYAAITADAYGNTPIDYRLVGEKLTATVPLTEKTIANLEKIMPLTTFAGAGNERVTIGKKSGDALIDEAAELVLHPQDEAGRDFDIVFYKAVVTSSVALSHQVDEQTVIEVTFEALIDESKSDGNYLGLIGDSAA